MQSHGNDTKSYWLIPDESRYYTIQNWRSILGFPEYQVSSLGFVKRAIKGNTPHSKANRIIASRQNHQGYNVATLYINGKQKRKKTHHLVLEAFKGLRPNSSDFGCHNDGNKLNNSIFNLDWKSPAENVKDRTRHGNTIRGEQVKISVLNTEAVKDIRQQAKCGKFKYGSFKKLMHKYNASESAIRSVINEKTWKHV